MSVIQLGDTADGKEGDVVIADEFFGPDSGIFKRFAQTHLGYDVKKLLYDCRDLNLYAPRDDSAMLYRGNQLNREKIFLVDSNMTTEKIPIYKYTGERGLPPSFIIL